MHTKSYLRVLFDFYFVFLIFHFLSLFFFFSFFNLILLFHIRFYRSVLDFVCLNLSLVCHDGLQENIHQYGGDPTQIWLVGQSAGAHLATMSILQQVYLRLSMSSDVVLSPVISPTPPPATASAGSGSSDIDDKFSLWNPSEIAGFIGISGPYELVNFQKSFIFLLLKF